VGGLIVSDDCSSRQPEAEWPDGPDVVVVGIVADGILEKTVREVATAMLEPLAQCYSAYVDSSQQLAPQGRVVLSADLGIDGNVLDARVERSDPLPAPLVDCALATLRAQIFAHPHDRDASVELDLRFVYRVLPLAVSER
jgi:hypothetical protein